MSIQFITSKKGITSTPSFNLVAGDVLIAFACNGVVGGQVTPSPEFITLAESTVTGQGFNNNVSAYVATVTGGKSVTGWTNTTNLLVCQYRGVKTFDIAGAKGSYSTLFEPDLPYVVFGESQNVNYKIQLDILDGSSWVFMAYNTNANTSGDLGVIAINNPYVQLRQLDQGGVQDIEVGVYDTDGIPLTTFAARSNNTHAGWATEWRSRVIELRAANTLGTLVATEQNDTAVSDADLGIRANSVLVDASDTIVSSSDLLINASLSLTEAADTLTSKGEFGISASLSLTEAADTLVSVADVLINSGLNLTEAADTIASDGELSIWASLSLTEAADFSTADAKLPINASLSLTEAADTIVSDGDLTINSSLSLTEAFDTILADAELILNASLSLTEEFDTVVSSASSSLAATLNITEASDALASLSVLDIQASLSVTEDPDTAISASETDIVANLIATEASDTVLSDGGATIQANLAETEENDGISSSSTLSLAASLIAVEDSDTTVSTAALLIAATSILTEQNDFLASDAALGVTANLSITEDDDKLITFAGGVDWYANIRLGADGCTNSLTPDPDGTCCVPDLCTIDPCSIICHYVDLLPSGPLWDRPKREALKQFQTPTPACVDDLFQVPCLWNNELCASLVRHSVYSSLRLYDLLLNALYPALRESDPITAFDTMDDWLVKLKWVDCFEGVCRSSDLGDLTPYEVGTICGSQPCKPEFPECLQTAVKHALLVALSRVQMGIIPNICSINWAIEPFGARLRPLNLNDDDGDGEATCPLRYAIEPISDTLPLWQREICIDQEAKFCQAWFNPNECQQTGLPSKIYPGLLTAECIVRSLLINCGTFRIVRVCEVPDEAYDCCENTEVVG